MKILKIIVGASLLTLLSACGGSSNSITQTETIIGTFVDEPVSGLTYECSSNLSGITNEKGEYRCQVGDTVTFSINGLKIGTTAAKKDFITPYSLFPDKPAAALNLARLLQSTDTSTAPDNGFIKLDQTTELPLNLDFSSATFDTDVGITLISAADAQKHLHENILSSGGEIPENATEVVIPDTTKPVITIKGDNPASVFQGSDYTDAGATATDNIDGTVSVSTSGTVNTATIGEYTLTYTATDAANNTATTTRTVNVIAVPDTTKPVITLKGDNPASVFQGRDYTDAGATATDNIDGTVSVSASGTVNTDTIGVYTTTYTATDAAKNTATATRTINVLAVPDTTKPVITLKGDNPASVFQGRDYTDAGATATDNIDGTVSVSASGTVNTDTIGVYTTTYTATDAAKNTATATRTINVLAVPDTTKPVITLKGDNPASVFQGSEYTDEGATATDNIDGTVSVSTSGTVDTDTIGEYTLTYTATDAANNTATATRTVKVIVAPDTDAPSTPTLLTTATATNQNTFSIEISGENNSTVWLGDVSVGTMGGDGKTTLSLDTSGEDGTKSFSITLKDAANNQSTLWPSI